MNALKLWEREVRAGIDGQRRDVSATWKLDALHAAACYELNAAELDAEAERAFLAGDARAYRIYHAAAQGERAKADARIDAEIEDTAA